MNGQGKRWSLKHRLLDLTHVLRRPVEIAALTGHQSVFIEVRVIERNTLNFMLCVFWMDKIESSRSPLNPPLKLYQTEQVTATTHAPLAPRCKHANQAGTSRAWNPHRLRSLPPDQPYQTICATHS